MPNFRLNRHYIFIYTYALFIINFKINCVLFHVNKSQFYKNLFRNRVNESTISRIVDRF